MTITLVPRRGIGAAPPSAVGKLATTLLSVAVAGMAEPSRFRRGRAYVAERAVTRIDVDPGKLTATVMGTRPDPYRVTVDVTSTRHDGSSNIERADVMRLTPEADDLQLWCTCPDEGDPCKHGIAALLAFAEELGSRPELLVEWRCGTSERAPRVAVGGRARHERHLRLAPEPLPVVSPFAMPEWRAFEGSELPPLAPLHELIDGFAPIDLVPTPVGQVGQVGRVGQIGQVDLAEVVKSALAVLRHLPPTPRRP